MEKLPFLEDIYPQNLLYAVTLRSPIAKGRLKSIQVPALPDGFLLITAKDIPGKNKLINSKIPILADTQLSYIGEPVAILIGHDKIKLDELFSSCVVYAEEETPVFHVKEGEPGFERVVTIGKTEEEFEKSGFIITGSYKTGVQEHWYAEPIGAITFYIDEYEKKKKKAAAPADNYHSPRVASLEKPLVVMTATQWPFHVKSSVLSCLGLDEDSVAVKPTALNLHMDGKLWYPSLVACHAALCTFITKKPVRLILNREEDFLYTPKRCASNVHIASTIDDNGNISSTIIDIFVNLGAYTVNEREILDQVCLGALSLYDYKNLKLTAKANYTNIPPQSSFSGFGIAQGFFAAERHVTLVSDTVNADPALWRLKNIDTKSILPIPQPKQIPSASELINMALKMSDYSRKWSSYELLRQSRKGKTLQKGDNHPRGIGIAIGYQGNSLLYDSENNGSYSLEVSLNKDSVIEITTSITTSEDYSRIWRKIVNDIMEIDNVKIITENAPDAGPSCSSRNIAVITKLVEKCCLYIQKQRFRDPLPITVRRSIKPQKGSIRGGLWDVDDISGFLKPALAAAVVEVTIDLVECIPIIRGVWLAIDGGKVISTNRAKRSLSRSAAQALGWAYTENIEYKNGMLPREQYENFKIFSPMEIPPIHIKFLDGDTSSGDSKGIGDLPFTCIPSAFLQAVSQAMDHGFKSIPLKRNDIWEMVRWGQHDD